MLLGVATGQVEQVDAVETRDVGFGVEEGGVAEAVDDFLVEEGETFGIVGNQGVSSHFRGNHIYLFSPFIGSEWGKEIPVDMLLQKRYQPLVLRLFGEVKPQVA